MDMTAAEYRTATLALARKIGPVARIWTYLNTSGPLFSAVLYSRGIGAGDSEFTVDGNTLSELFASVSEKWDEYEGTHRDRTIRKMALAIIRITAELGECTDAALRNCGEFDSGEIATYGEQACADANDIAGRGPFSIIVNGGANTLAAYEPRGLNQ